MIFLEIYVKMVSMNGYGEDSLLAESFLFHLITNYVTWREASVVSPKLPLSLLISL